MARPRFAFVLTALAVLSVAVVAAASSLKLIDKPDASFTAKGVGGLKIKGSSTDFKAKDEDGKLTLRAKIKGMKTGIKLRDEHTDKYLGVAKGAKYEHATLVVAKDKLKFPADKASVTAKAKGTFTMHDVPKEREFNYTVERHGSDLIVSGWMEVDITEHKIEKPCYLGVCVDPKIRVDVKFKLREEG